MDVVPRPDYTDGWAAFNVATGGVVEPVLLYEGARLLECDKHHRTLCGLNGTTMKFGAKAPGRGLEGHCLPRPDQCLARHRHRGQHSHSRVHPRPASPHGRRHMGPGIRYEVMATLRPGRLALLCDAGETCIQPGIGRLNPQVPRLMDQGVHGTHNVCLLCAADEDGPARLDRHAWWRPARALSCAAAARFLSFPAGCGAGRFLAPPSERRIR